MEEILLEILGELRAGTTLDDKRIEAVLNRHNKLAGDSMRKYAKKRIAPYYLKVKHEEPARWNSWNVDPDLEARLMAAVRMKPRRTASGVATITVLTKPWECSSNCLYCPNDVRMPKSYLHDEPACQRAERNFFDPYLQVASRLRALVNMGHITDKVELIVLGGTWTDYPRSYQIWFAEQLFAALNDDAATRERRASQRRRAYKHAGLSNDADQIARAVRSEQEAIVRGEGTYNAAVQRLYRRSSAWQDVERWQTATIDQLYERQRCNETAVHRVVGLVMETRPDDVDAESLRLLRQLGATKLQMGIQSLDNRVLAMNRRAAAGCTQAGSPRADAPCGAGEADGNLSSGVISPNAAGAGAACTNDLEAGGPACSALNATQQAARAIDLARLFGFKVHTHFMVNLYGSSPESDMAQYRRFMTDARFQPDEVKIYPCALVAGTGLVNLYESGAWRPYGEAQLIDVLAADTIATPPFCRISRMIRDISAGDILAGNKKGNLRQLVDERIARTGAPVREIRSREISTDDVDMTTLRLQETPYTTLHTQEVFLQWVTPDEGIAGFLRLSLPDSGYVATHPELPVIPGHAMIREVHVYGRVASIGNAGEGAQHAGLGRALVQRACDIAVLQGYSAMNVISAVGTREYYRHLGFSDNGLYLSKPLPGLIEDDGAQASPPCST